jgi:hypothetical protein
MLLFISNYADAQVNNLVNNGAFSEAVKIGFSEKEIVIVRGQIISNVLKVINTAGSPFSFYVNLNFPSTWKTLTSS